jgi:hypothetical protein
MVLSTAKIIRYVVGSSGRKWNDNENRKTAVLEEDPIRKSLRPKQISYGLAWKPIRACTLTDRRPLTQQSRRIVTQSKLHSYQVCCWPHVSAFSESHQQAISNKKYEKT